MSHLTITCPSCNEAFSADQTLQNHLKNKKQKYQEETKVKDKFLKERNLEKKLALKAKQVDKVIITRPTVSKEDIGFLPGDIKEKMDNDK